MTHVDLHNDSSNTMSRENWHAGLCHTDEPTKMSLSLYKMKNLLTMSTGCKPHTAGGMARHSQTMVTHKTELHAENLYISPERSRRVSSVLTSFRFIRGSTESFGEI